MFKFYIYKLGKFIANALSLKAAYRFGIFISDLQYVFSFRDRRAVRSNLRLLLPHERNIEPLVRDVFRNFGKYLVEFFRMDKDVDAAFVMNKVRYVNLAYVDEVLKEKHGGILLTAHIGNWELGSVVISTKGYPIAVIALPHKERPVNDLFNHQREIKGVRVIPANIAIRRCLETLKGNSLLAIASDRDFSANGETMDFLGKTKSIPRGAAVFSRRLKTPIIPAFLARNGDDTFSLIFEKPLYPDLQKEEEASIVDLMSQYTRVIEDKIREYPTQWLVFREFWRE